MVNKTRRAPKCNFKNVTLKSVKKELQTFDKVPDIHDIIYKPPVKKDLAVGLVYFNSSKSKRLLMNYLYIREKLRVSDIPFYTLEMYENQPEISDAFHYKTDFILFQKERLCYLLEKKIPKSFTKLVFLDCDVIFDNLNWYNELSDKLNSFNIVQPFSKGIWLDIEYNKIVRKRISIVYHLKLNKIKVDKLIGGTHSGGGYHAGFGWAFQRGWFNKVGIYQYAILGRGDRYNCRSWIRDNDYPVDNFIKNTLDEYRSSLNTDLSVCFLEGSIYHLWHGDIIKRQYDTRMDIFKSIKDIRDIIKVGDNGLFELKDNSLKPKIRKYFEDRDDDGLEV